MTGWQTALAIAALLFLGYLVVRLRPRRERRAGLTDTVRAARLRVLEAGTPRARAEALAAVGTIAAREGARWTSAAGYFLRAMNADPTWPGGVQQTVASLRRRRPRMLEKILWRRLGALPWDDAHRAVLREAAASLSALYAKELHDKHRAAACAKLAEELARVDSCTVAP
jgi:hypothetical protein